MKDKTLTKTRPIWNKSLVSGGVILVGALFFAGPAAMWSVALGVLIALVNFWLLEKLVAGIVARKRMASGKLIAVFAVKLLVLFGAVALAVLKLPIEAGPFLLGLSCLVMGITWEGLSGLRS